MSTPTTTRRTPGRPPAAAPGTPALARAMGRLADARAWALGAVVYAGCAAGLFWSSAAFAVPTVQDECGQSPPDVRFASSAAEVHDFLAACGPAGREAYRALQLADLVYPAVFAFFLATSLALALRLLAPGRVNLLALAALPFLAAAFDYLENVCAWLALVAWPRAGVADGLLGLASAAKTVTSWTAGILLLVVLAALVLRRGRSLLARYHRDGRLEPGGRR
jgi:hypothetical protein